MLEVSFNGRELALLIWGGVFVFVSLATSVGELGGLVGTAALVLKTRLAWMFLSLVPYLIGVVYLLDWIGFWHGGFAFPALFWTVTAGWGMVVVGIKRDEKKLIASAVGLISLTLVVEAFVSFKTFSLPIELVVVPVLMFFLFAQAVGAKSKRADLSSVQRSGERGLMIVWVILFLYVPFSIATDWHDFNAAEALRSLALPVILTLATFPYVAAIWALSLRSTRRVERRRAQLAQSLAREGEETFESGSMKRAA